MSGALAPKTARGVVRPPSPYVGLVPFGENDAAFFFGRSQEVEIVAANLRSARLTILYGPSGVGKSSLLMAGAVHRLREDVETAAAASPIAICVFRSWRDDPVRGLCQASRNALQEFDAEPLPAPGATLAETLRGWTEQTGTLLVVLDQFEEYFQYHPGEGDGARLTGFAAELGRIVNDPSLPVHVLLSIREDAWAKLDHFEGHIPSLFANYLRVEHLDVDAARKAIEDPIVAWNRTLPDGDQPYEIEAVLTDAVIAAAVGGELALAAEAETAAVDGVGDRVEAPFLQLVLERLWYATLEDGAHALTLSRLEALGGARRIVENHLLEALGKLRSDEQAVAANVFRFLVTRSKTKIAHSAADLAEWTKQPEPGVSAVLDRLSGGETGRVLRAVAPAVDEGQGKRYELFHDVLAEPILQWRRRYERDRERSRLIRIGGWLLALVAIFAGLSVYAFIERGHARSQARHAQARELEALSELSTNPRSSLIEALRAAKMEPGARAEVVLRNALIASRLRDVVSAAGPVGTVAYSDDGRLILVAGGADARVYSARSHQRLHVLHSSAPITAAAFVGEHRVFTGAADGSTRLWDTRSGRSRRWRSGPGPVTSVSKVRGGVLLVTWKGGQAVVASIEGGRICLLHQPGPPTSGGALDPTGRFAATISADRTGHVEARVYDAHSGVLLHVLPPLGVADVAFSPRESLLAVASRDGSTTLWQPATGRRLRPPLDDGGDSLFTAAFSPTGTLLATAGADGGVRVWKVSDGERLYNFVGHAGHVVALAWSRDGHILADASTDGTSRIWEVTGSKLKGRFVASLTGSGGPVTSVAFSRDGRTLVTGSADSRARIWDAHSEEELTVLGRHDGVTTVAFSPNGRLVVSAGADGTARIWDVGRLKELRRLRDGAPVVAADFSADRRTVTVTRSEARLWDWQDERVRADAKTAPIRLAGLSEDRRVLLLAGGRRLEMWDLGDGSLRLRVRFALQARTISAMLGADGTRIAVTTGDGSVSLWSTNGEQLWSRRVPGPTAVALSPDGRTVAASGAHGVTYVWAGDGQLRRRLPVPTPKRPLTSLTFSPDSRRLLTTRNNGEASVWDVQAGHRVRRLHALIGQFGNIAAAAFSADSRWIATAGPVTVVLWSAQTGELLYYLRGPTKQVTSVAFAPGGRVVAASSKDGTVRIYRCKVCGGLTELEAQANADLALTGG